ncbi:MAG: hypothetical protein Q9167_007472 [Letrouitia subvulpina]
MAANDKPRDAWKFTDNTHKDTYPAIDSANSDLSGKNILITGASRGIGRALAISCAKAGAAGIVLAARSDVTAVEHDLLDATAKAGKGAPQVLKIKLDVADRPSVENAAKEVEDKLSWLDVLVNNAGFMDHMHPLADVDPDNWWYTWEVNLKGPYLMTRTFLPLLLKGSNKTIVNTSSIGAHLTSPGFSAYQTAKFALLRLTEFINVDHGHQGIIAFAVHPGSVMSDLVTSVITPDYQHRKQQQQPRIEAFDLKLTVTAVFQDQPELGGDTIVFLTQKRQDWLAGRFISVTWDMPELFAEKDVIVAQDLLKMKMTV